MRDGLRTLLRAIPQIELVIQADDSPSAIEVVMDEHPPAFILLDSDLLDDQLKAAINQAKLKSPQTHCIVLADNLKQQEMAWANGADEVLLAGFSATKLFNSIEKMLTNGNQESCAYKAESL
jgi:DNA-binding NarL/FixJ family response regulator